MAGIKNVMGTANFGREGGQFESREQIQELFQILLDNGCNTLDTATLYGASEGALGDAKAGDKFVIDTKHKGGFGGEGNASKENVIADATNSKEKLGVNVDIFYIHAPDKGTPLEKTLEGVNEMHGRGFFKRFGLSNYKVEDVQKVYDICKEKGYPLPSVYQGNYNAVARKQEEVLFPTLRKLGMAFYAYSPMAGGFLTKSKQEILDGKGRFDTSTTIGQMYGSMYNKASFNDILTEWEAIAKDEGATRAELAYRWVKYNSPLKPEHGDAIIIGASSLAQLQDTVKTLNKGPLSDAAVKRIHGIWEKIEHDAPLDNFHR